MENISEQMAQILETLGNTVPSVVQTLKSEGVQGVRNTVRFLNPIVRYVQGRLLISHLGMDVMDSNNLRITLLEGEKQDAPIPPAVLDFLSAFNRGDYPELEMPMNLAQNNPLE